MAISKERQAMANKMGMSDKTYMKYIRAGEVLKRIEGLIGKEKSDCFNNIISENKYSVDKILKIAELTDIQLMMFIENVLNDPDKLEFYYAMYFPIMVKVTCEIPKDTNKKLMEKAKEIGMSRKQYIECILNTIAEQE